MNGLKNIKISVKLLNFDYVNRIQFLKHRYSKAKFTVHDNFMVLKEIFTYILFKPKNNEAVCHLNITKIPSFDSIQKSIHFATRLFHCTYNPHSIRIDNMTYLHYLNNNVNLPLLYDTFHSNFRLKYNNSVFPGLNFKNDIGSAIIFHTGIVIIVGCKTINQVYNIISIVEKWNAFMNGSKMN